VPKNKIKIHLGLFNQKGSSGVVFEKKGVKLAPLTLKFFDDFELKIASKHPFLNQAIHFIFLNSFPESNHRIF
jgi:hypothetical protein